MNENQQVYFKNIQGEIIELINNSKFEIIIAVAWITDEYILGKLLNKSKNGIRVSILFYDDRINNKILFKGLYENGARIRHTSKLMHNKFCVIDRSIVINGSYNWTNNASKNHENIQVTIDSTKITQEYLNEFERIYEKSKSIGEFFKSEDDKFEEYLLSQPYPSSFPTFLKFDLYSYLTETSEYLKNINFIYVLLIKENDYTYFHKFKFNNKNKTNYNFFGLYNLGWFFNVYKLNDELDYNQDFITFNSEKMLVVHDAIGSSDHCIYIINQNKEIVSPQIKYRIKGDYKSIIEIEKENVMIKDSQQNKIWYHRDSLIKNEVLNSRYKVEEDAKRERISQKRKAQQKIEMDIRRNSQSCYIATMVYKDINHPKVNFLRFYRDNKLQKYYLGKKFIYIYYKYSPNIVIYLKDKKTANTIIKSILNLLIFSIKK